MSIPYLHASETKLMLQVKKDLDRHESFREYAYPDPLSELGKKYKGKGWEWGFYPARQFLACIKEANPDEGKPWTYGFGFTHLVTPDSTISRITAERMLEGLILEQYSQLVQRLSWIKQASFVTKTVLINMAFNLGQKGLLKFVNTLALVKGQQYEAAARAMGQSLWARQTGVRATELIQRMKTQSIEPLHQAGETING